MNCLTDLDELDIRELERRAVGRCITFNNHHLPIGCDPRRGRVGIEVIDEPRPVRLHIDRRTRYRGCDLEVEQWTTNGTRTFETVTEALDWLTVKTALDEPEPVERALFIDRDQLADQLADEVIGQHTPLRTTSRAVARHLARVEPRRPLTLLFAGPTGVGKTQTAVTLGAALRSQTEQPWPFVRLDMSEMSEPHSVAKILGAPPGYVGYRDESQLVTTLHENPRAVVLFDEIEKAHPNVFLAIMNLLDAGRLVAHGDGRKVDARQAIMIFTSNVGADVLLERLHELRDEADQLAIDGIGRAHLHRHGVPAELAGRITHVCVFRPLGPNAQREILHTTIGRVAGSYGLQLTDIDHAALTALQAAVSTSGAGVRGMEYAIDALIGDLIVDARRAGKQDAVLTTAEGKLTLS